MKDFLRLLRQLLPYKGYAALNILFNLLSVMFSLFSMGMAIPFLGILFDNEPLVTSAPPLSFSAEAIKENFYYFLSQLIIEDGAVQALFAIGLLVVAGTFFKTLFRYLANYFITPVRNGVVRDIRNNIFDKILILPLGYFTEARKGDIIARATSDVQEVEWSILSSVEMLFRDPITIFVYLGFLIFLSPHLTLFVLILLPLTGVIIGYVGRTLRSTSRKGQNEMGMILSVIEETLGGMRIIKAFNAEGKVKERFLYSNNKFTRLMNKLFRRRYLANPMSEFLSTAAMISIMLYGGSLILDNQSALSSQAFIGYLIVFSQIINPAKSFSTSYYKILKGMASIDRINSVLRSDIKIKEKKDARSLSNFEKSIQYKDVSFKYDQEWVLKDIQLNIAKGKTVALVGQSGSGKTTLVDLLPRFYEVENGEICIDDIPVKELKIKDLRNLMGIVTQESILFNDTIFNNIAFGIDKAKEQDVIAAAKIANAHEFIMQTEKGYQTNIGEGGNRLSGGQRQRISIARAILKNPPILILDEATSALDTESERLVQDALERLMENRTSVVIAHRLSTIKDADLICVMQSGKIVERGTHKQLYEKRGVYKKLCDLQMFS